VKGFASGVTYNIILTGLSAVDSLQAAAAAGIVGELGAAASAVAGVARRLHAAKS